MKLPVENFICKPDHHHLGKSLDEVIMMKMYELNLAVDSILKGVN